MNGAPAVSLGADSARSLARGGLTVTDARFGPGLTLPRHNHAEASVVVILSGGFELTIAGGERDCRPGAVLTEPAAEPHSNRFTAAGTRVVAVQVDTVLAVDLGGAGVRLDRVTQGRDRAAAFLAWRLVQELDVADSLTAVAVEGVALELLTAAARSRRPAAGGRPGWLTAVEQLVNAGFPGPLDPATLAVAAGVHPVHLARVWRTHHGCSLAESVRQHRVGWVAQRLATTNRPIADLAAAAGFTDQSHLARTFRRSTGLTPSDYRRLLRK